MATSKQNYNQDYTQNYSQNYKHSPSQLTHEKIEELGNAIKAQSELILEAYLSNKPVQYQGKQSKSFRHIRDYGIIEEYPEGIRPTNEMRQILHKMSKKNHHLHVMPDIEQWKQQIENLSKLAQNSADNFDFANEDRYLEQITDTALMLASALRQEMANIEYTININLNNSYDIKAKRIMLQDLEKKIKSQTNKIQSLSRNELHACYGDNYKVRAILSDCISEVVDTCITELDQYLTKSIILIDKLQTEQNRQNQQLWAVNQFIKNGHYQPNNIQLSFDELVEHGLAFGGMLEGEDYADNALNIDTELEDNKHFLLTVLDNLSESKYPTNNHTEINNNYDNPVQKIDETDKVNEISKEQQLVFEYLKYNNREDFYTSLSVREYWQAFELEPRISYKAFLALVLHQCKNNFRNDNLVYSDVKNGNTICWKIYLKTSMIGLADTINVHDAHYIRYNKQQGEPTSEQIWKTT